MAHGPRLPIVARNPQMLNASHALAAKSGARRRSLRYGLIAPSGCQSGAPWLSKDYLTSFHNWPETFWHLSMNAAPFIEPFT